MVNLAASDGMARFSSISSHPVYRRNQANISESQSNLKLDTGRPVLPLRQNKHVPKECCGERLEHELAGQARRTFQGRWIICSSEQDPKKRLCDEDNYLNKCLTGLKDTA